MLSVRAKVAQELAAGMMVERELVAERLAVRDSPPIAHNMHHDTL